MFRTSWRSGALGAALIFMMAGPETACSNPWAEVGDAGDLLPTAQITVGVDPLTSISGEVSTSLDKDIYRITITDPLTFSATVLPGGSLTDTQLFLFDAFGMGIYANDDMSAVDTLSALPAGDTSGPTTAGPYFLAISGSDNDPTNLGVEIFTDGILGVQTPTIAAPLDGWTPTFSVFGGTYTIALTGAGFANTTGPTPGDGNGDGWVDGLDYLLWAGAYGTHPGPDGDISDGDYNDDGWVDGLDYLLWAGEYGSHASTGVPEPTALLLIVVGIVPAMSSPRRRRC